MGGHPEFTDSCDGRGRLTYKQRNYGLVGVHMPDAWLKKPMSFQNSRHATP
jgi:hypothetical protein